LPESLRRAIVRSVEGENPKQSLAAADAAWAARDTDGLVAHLAAAVRGFTAAGDVRSAAMACVRLGEAMATALGNLPASRAWFARARRLLADLPPCPEQGWAAVGPMGCDVDDPDELAAAAELALDRARHFGDVNLEAKALADAGLADVQRGRIPDGMKRLDEAMALACGPVDNVDVAAKSVCSFFTACYHAADFERAAAWVELLARRGLIGPAPGGPVFLSSHCHSVEATMLVELGRWREAEALLERARAEFAAVMGLPAWHPDIALADLRIRQGRLTDAEALLLGKEEWMQALLPTARLHLARGDHALARRAAARGLRALGVDRLRRIEVLTVLVDAQVGLDDRDAAEAACAELERCTADVGVAPLVARATAARARLALASGDPRRAVALLEGALDELEPQRFPWLRATLLIATARARLACGDEAGAAANARLAAACLEPLDTVLAPGDAALLHRLHAAPRPPQIASLGRRGRQWLLQHAGTTLLVGDTKGMRYLAELVASPGVERHVLDLVDRCDDPDRGRAAPALRRALGDAGPVSDARARRAYRRRAEELRDQIAEAERAGDVDRALTLQAELDAVVRQLAAAFGLGGRDRRAASAAERARLNVTRALRAAIARVGAALPEAGGYLGRRVRTGRYCVYEPSPDDSVRWVFSPD
jgi:hypothetical protein